MGPSNTLIYNNTITGGSGYQAVYLDDALYTNISSNRIEVNTTALPNFNKSAVIYLYNLSFSDPRIL